MLQYCTTHSLLSTTTTYRDHRSYSIRITRINQLVEYHLLWILLYEMAWEEETSIIVRVYHHLQSRYYFPGWQFPVRLCPISVWNLVTGDWHQSVLTWDLATVMCNVQEAKKIHFACASYFCLLLHPSVVVCLNKHPSRTGSRWPDDGIITKYRSLLNHNMYVKERQGRAVTRSLAISWKYPDSRLFRKKSPHSQSAHLNLCL